MPERVYALDCLDPILVTLTAQNKPVIFNMADPSRPFRVRHYLVLFVVYALFVSPFIAFAPPFAMIR